MWISSLFRELMSVAACNIWPMTTALRVKEEEPIAVSPAISDLLNAMPGIATLSALVSINPQVLITG